MAIGDSRNPVEEEAARKFEEKLSNPEKLPGARYGTYLRFDGDELRVEVTEQRRIGKGDNGEVFEVKGRVEGKGPAGTFVLKKFYDGEELSRNEIARKVFENYTNARAAGLKVFPTFRLNEADGTILMTIGYNKEWHCVSANNRGSNSLEDFGGKKLEQIPDFENFCQSVLEEAKKATEAGVFLPGDSFFFIVRKDTSKLDFYLGDVDTVQKAKLEEGQSLSSMNIIQAKAALSSFIEKNVADEEVAFRYIDQLYKTK